MPSVDVVPDFTDRLATALWCAEQGWAVFPVRDKEPVGRWPEQATTDPQVFADWFIDVYNVGIACGPSGLLVVDEDHPDGLEQYARSVGATVPETFRVRTGKGQHFYFRDGGDGFGNSPGPLRAFGCDVRGRGGYVVGPGSVHPSGARYLPLDPEVPVAPLPDFLAAALGQGTSPRQQHAWSDPPSRGLAALPEVIRGPRDDAAGERHDVLLGYATSLRGRGLPRAEAEVLFHAAWSRCEQPPACETPLPWGGGAGQGAPGCLRAISRPRGRRP